MRRRWHIGASTLLAAGTVAMIAGTFAPWLQSGQVQRNSYRTAGLLQRLLDVDGTVGVLVDSVPLLALICALLSVGYIAGWHRTAAAGLALLALAISALSVVVLLAPSAREIHAVATGPVISLTGALITFVTALPLVASPRAD